MIRRIAVTLAVTLIACLPASAEEFVGPNGSFTLDFGPDWQVIQSQNRAGLSCKTESCGEDRVFCILLPRSDEAAQPGKPLPDMLVRKFGDGVVSAPAGGGAKTSYVAPFAARTLGATQGSWAEIRSVSDKADTHFGLFLFAAPGFDVAFTCGAPEARWSAHRDRIERLLASAKLSPDPAPTPEAAPSPPAPQDPPK